MKNVKLLTAILVAMIVCTISIHRAHAQEFGPANPDSTTKWETTPIIVDTKKTDKLRLLKSEPLIADISKWQGNINWSKASQKLDLVIIRTQHGSTEEDTYHKKNEAGAKKYGVPFGVYAFSLAESTSDAKVEANNFYNRADKDAQFYVIDVEKNTSKSGESMRKITNAYIQQLRKKTDKKIGLYIAHHLYKSFNLDTSKADFVWIPRYSTSKPDFAYDLWQYTDKGRIDGINANVDLNRLNPNLTLAELLAPVKSIEDTKTDTKENEQPVTEPASVHTEYYSVKPAFIITKTAVGAYSSTTFNNQTKIGNVKKNTILTIQGIEYSSTGYPRLKTISGSYITANKSYVIGLTSKYKNYVITKPNYVKLIKNVNQYSNISFTNSSKVSVLKKGVTLNIKGISYTAAGTPRLQLTNGNYITANKNSLIAY
ncbi:N-acetylmuramoyl-L-alanine amidase [Rummeliibacillus sp. TYF005]|uniref:DUF5776 domain-containing protein n=1 Tax=unclassified Rummeliibacillus TaxID=2622809 RepID=UPI000E66962E|nr:MULTISPECIES: DUF5776 domain-containing protein [unclassified Rummeliibacillus]RIJ63089.1 N-acetylmuramoyl-L-alanine amidase [Rummeliibacillus sp. POC4]RPJ97172.1 N-acetylmuramoyl-L-alanine amidase [Rummeliibacillus sp. TYF005]